MRLFRGFSCAVVLAWAVPCTGQSLTGRPGALVVPAAREESQVSRGVAQRPRLATGLHRVFIGISGGSQATSLDFTDTKREPLSQETATWNAGYAVESGLNVEVGGGVRVWRNLAAGLTFSRFEDKRIATVTGELPHPFFFNRLRQVSGESERLNHTEQGVHLSAIWLLPATRRVQAAVFAGPTFFSVNRGLVERFNYTESYPYDEATFQGVVIDRISSNHTGFHAGADVSWFFTDAVGVGGIVRFARGTGRLDSPASDATLSIDLGGLQAGAGVRMRFGPRR